MAFAAWASGSGRSLGGRRGPRRRCAVQLLTLPNTWERSAFPRGGLHGYFHAILRAAVHKGATLRTSCPVDEILDRGRPGGGRAPARDGGHRAAEDDSRQQGRDRRLSTSTRRSSKMVGPKHLDPGRDSEAEGHQHQEPDALREHLPDEGAAALQREDSRTGNPARSWSAPTGSRHGRRLSRATRASSTTRTSPTSTASKGQPTVLAGARNVVPDSVPGPRSHRLPGSPSAGVRHDVPSRWPSRRPTYHVEGEDAPGQATRTRWTASCASPSAQVFDGLDDDNVLHHWSASGRDVEFRNTGLIGGTWCGSRHCEDQLWTNRPIPELARYRSPIEGLYHAHQTSGHPGGLCLMAIPYNLMHILIEDGIAEPGDVVVRVAVLHPPGRQESPHTEADESRRGGNTVSNFSYESEVQVRRQRPLRAHAGGVPEAG